MTGNFFYERGVLCSSFHVYSLKRVLSSSYPAQRRVWCVHNIVLYRTKHCCASPFQTCRAHLTKFVNLCNLMTRSDPVRRPYFRFERSLIEPRQIRLDTQGAQPNLSIYFPAMTRLDHATRLHLRFMGSLLELHQALLDTQRALDLIFQSMSLL